MVVVYGCNRKWYKYLEVNIFSLLKYNNSVDKVYILCEDDDISAFNKLEKMKSTFNVDFIIYDVTKMINSFFDGSHNSNTVYTDLALSKLLISNIVKEDKVLYLDVDLIVKGDLSYLWNYNIDDYYAAGVLDNGGFDNNHKYRVGAYGKYINTGVLLLNCKKLRDDNIVSKFFEIINSKDLLYPDQDAFNIVCGNNVIYVPSMFNFALNNNFPVTKYVISDDLRYIYHYTGNKKDWIADKDFCEEWYHEYDDYFRRFNKIEKDISIAFCSNRKLYKYLAFNVYSLLKSNNNIRKIYLVIEDDDISSIPNINNVISKYDVEIEAINFINIQNKYLTNHDNMDTIFSNFCFARLLLSELTNEDKIIYLDMDTIVCKDISVLWNIDFDDNYALGVKDYGVLDQNRHYDTLNIDYKYVNTGVLVLDLNKIRKDGLVDKIFEVINRKKLVYPDQDAFNIACCDKIKYIPSIFNCIEFVTRHVFNLDDVYIYHYAGDKTNWIRNHNLFEKYYDEYYKYLNEFNIDYSEI